MAGSGVAIRLHEFKEKRGTSQYQGSTERTSGALRQGRDVRGLYPGQLGRVHVIQSPQYRMRFLSLERHVDPGTYRHDALYPRSFDLLTLQALDLARREGHATALQVPQTSYQQEFGFQSCIHHSGETKLTLCSHSKPLVHWSHQRDVAK